MHIALLHRRRSLRYGGSADPLGAGNTQLIADLGVTPLAFWDVRKNLTLDGSGNASSLVDVVNGIAAAQATTTKRPHWDGTALTFDGVDDFLVTSALAAFDLSQAMTLAIIAKVPAVSSTIIVQLTGANFWRVGVLGTAFQTSSTGPNATSTAQAGTGDVRLILASITTAAQSQAAIEVPNVAKVTGGLATALAAGACAVSFGATNAGGGPLAIALRAALLLPGVYSTAQRDTLKAWAQTYHGAVLA